MTIIVIVSADDLDILHESVPMERWKTLLRNAGLKHRGIHMLRHTHASNLIAQGLHIKSISERLGDTSIKTTMDTYGHMMEEMTKPRLKGLWRRGKSR